MKITLSHIIKNTNLRGLVLLCVLSITTSVYAGLLNQAATIQFVKKNNLLQFVIVDELNANKGIVNAAEYKYLGGKND